jgi:ubiquinone/menaquinone biosynthesis C-methylase UbiE
MSEPWDAEAATFDDEPDHGLRDPGIRAAWLELLTAHLPAAPARVADLGCGTGTLSVLLADAGFTVDGVDFSPEMVNRARDKAVGRDGVTFTVADASDPPLEEAAYDAVLCRHVLWALPDPSAALARWVGLLRPGGRLVLVEGRWHTESGLTAAETEAMLRAAGSTPTTYHLREEIYWGGPITDERYLVVSS